MTTSPHLISPQRKKINEHAHMGRYEHENMYHILGMDGEESECSLDEPLFDEGQEISDVEFSDADQEPAEVEGQKAAKTAAPANADGRVEDPPAPHQAKRIRSIA